MKPVIGNGCHIGAGAVVVGPIFIGENSVVGANVVIASDVPPESLVRPPAPTIRPLRRSPEDIAIAAGNAHQRP
jgi:serine O-acetyltransferase